MSNFKKALKTTLLFLVILVVVHVGIFECYFQTENYPYQDYVEREALSGSLDYIVLGSSHATWVINPKVIDETLGVNSYNLGNEWMSMKTRYQFLEYELARNPIDTLVLEVSYDAIRATDDLGDLFALGRWSTPRERWSFFFNNFRISQYRDVYNFCFTHGMECLEWSIRDQIHRTNPDPRVYRGYFAQDAVNVACDYKAAYNSQPMEFTLHEESVEYLQKIVDLCREHDISLSMVTVPFSKAVICKKTNLDAYRAWYEEFAEKNRLVYIDFNLLKDRDTLFPDETSFINEEHLGGACADLFTGMLLDTLERAQAGEDISEEFFSTYEEFEGTQDYTK